MRKKQERVVIYKEVAWEDWSDKAIRFDLIICYHNGGEEVKKIFAPKTLLNGDKLPYWFISKKYQEQVQSDMKSWKVKGDYKILKQTKLDI